MNEQRDVKKHYSKNDILLHSWTNQHQEDPDATKASEIDGRHWKRIVFEALYIHREQRQPIC